MSETLLTQARPADGGRQRPQSGPDSDPFDGFSMPGHLGIEPDTSDEFKALARELGLSPDDAMRLVSFYEAAHQRRHLGWRNKAISDREIGGHNLPRTMATAARAVERFGGQPLRQALEDTGAGNHPEVIRHFYRVGKALSEDSLVRPTHGRVSKSYGETFYPKHNFKE